MNTTNRTSKLVADAKNDKLDFQIFMVVVAQQVRVADCGSEGRGFESHLPPNVCNVRNEEELYSEGNIHLT